MNDNREGSTRSWAESLPSHGAQDLEHATESAQASSSEILGYEKRIEFMRLAGKELETRRRRIGIFGNTMFAEAGWEVLLALYTTQGARQTIASINRLITTAPTTTLRWIEHLELQTLIRRELHPTDARMVLIELTTKGVKALDAYFSEASRMPE